MRTRPKRIRVRQPHVWSAPIRRQTLDTVPDEIGKARALKAIAKRERRIARRLSTIPRALAGGGA